MAAGPTFDERPPGAGGSATLFVSDPTAEAEQVARALRSSGYIVVDVPLAMLVARAAVQRPRVVLIDADSQGALDVVTRMRELPHGEEIHVLFVAAPGGAMSSPEESLASEGSGFFLRPVDLPALLREVATLTRVSGQAEEPPAFSTTPAPSIAASSNPPGAPPATVATFAPRAGSGSSPPNDRPSSPSLPPTSVAWAAASRAVGLGPPVSAELQRLLAEAEQRAHVVSEDSVAPSADQEVEAVLPADLLAALDEPLDDDDREPEPEGRTHPPARERTNDGGATRTTGASGTGTGATPHGTGTGGTGGGEEGLTPGPSEGVSGPSARPSARAKAAPNEEVDDGRRLHPGGEIDRVGSMSVGPWQAMRRVAQAIAARKSGTLAFLSSDAERRIVLREGDVVTCASTAEGESLLAFLGVRGDLPRETVRRLGSRFPAFGRHAGAALVARGYLRQDQMWTTLRAHAEWVLSRVLQAPEARVVAEAQPQGRLAAEPSVFGGAPGAEVFVEVVRRVVAPSDAIERLGGAKSRLASGAAARLLAECALAPLELDLLKSAPGRSLGEVLDSTVDDDFATTVFAVTELDILEVVRATDAAGDGGEERSADVAALDSEAIRERVRARLQLVEDGDYFSILGVARDATGYDLRRAFLELRREFDPSRLLSAEVADLADDVRTVTTVLEEAYEILKDPARRERYRRAIEGAPQG